jgi:hypothetical protein
MPSEAVDIDVGQLVYPSLKDCPFVVDLHELSPIDGRATGRRDWRRLELFHRRIVRRDENSDTLAKKPGRLFRAACTSRWPRAARRTRPAPRSPAMYMERPNPTHKSSRETNIGASGLDLALEHVASVVRERAAIIT